MDDYSNSARMVNRVARGSALMYLCPTTCMRLSLWTKSD